MLWKTEWGECHFVGKNKKEYYSHKVMGYYYDSLRGGTRVDDGFGCEVCYGKQNGGGGVIVDILVERKYADGVGSIINNIMEEGVFLWWMENSGISSGGGEGTF